MFCPNCGAQIPNDSRFCQECGARQERPSAPATELSQRTKWIILGFVGAFVLFLVAGVLSIAIKPTISLNDYLVAEFSGYDNYGQANIGFDRIRFLEDYGEKLVTGKEEDEDPYVEAERFLNVYVNGQADKTENLSNGDVINYTWECDDEQVLERYGYKLKYSDVQYTVEGLEVPQDFDPFEGLDVQFEGIAPYGTATIIGTATHAAAENLRFYLDTAYELDEGMTVTMTFDTRYYVEDLNEYFVTTYGVRPLCLEKTFEVRNLDRYISSLEEVSDSALEDMQLKAEEAFADTLTGENEELKGFTYCGTYLLTDDENQDSWFNNELYLVYQAQIQNDYTDEDEEETFSQLTEFYWYISFEDLLTNNSGEVMMDVEDYETASQRFTVDSGISTGWFSTKKWYYYGYMTLDALYESAISSQTEYFTCISDVAAPAAN